MRQGASVHRLAESIEHASKQLVSNRDPKASSGRPHLIPRSYATEFTEWHQERSVPAKANDLSRNLFPAREQVTDVADTGVRTVTLDDEANDLSDPAEDFETA